MINRFAVVSASLSLFVAAPLLAEVPPIEKIAPENSILILGASNTTKAIENVKKTGLWQLWQSERMKTMRADAMKELDESLAKMMEELGVEKDSLVPPTGPAGLALFTVTDPDLGTPEMSIIAFADYGDQADKTEALIKAALDKGAKDGKLEFEEKEVGGRTVLAIDLSKMTPEAPAEEDEFGGMPGMPMPDPAEILEGFMKFNYVREGGTLMLSTDMTALTDALDAIDGKAGADGGKFSVREDFQNTVSQIGNENDAYAVLLTRDVMDLLGEQGAMMMMFRPTIRALTGEVAGYGAGVRFDTGAAMTEQTIGIYMPNGKKGLTELIDHPAGRGDIPAFVAADVASYSTYNFDFGGVMDVVKSVVNSNPMLAGQAGEVMDQVEPMMTPIFNSLGDKIVMSNTGAAPLISFQCSDPQAFENGFAGLAAQGGLESRDFLGQRIYTMEEGINLGMPGMGGGAAAEPMSIGIGGGFVFLGDTPSVEQALRSTGNADAPTLAKNEMYQKAVAALGNDPVVAWGYMDFVSGFDEMAKSQLETLKQSIAEVKEFDPEMAAEMEASLASRTKLLEQINSDFLKQYIGPTVWQMRSTDKGFVINSYVLPAM